MLGHKNAYEVAMHVGKQTNFVRELFNDKSTEGVARYENIQELLNSIKEWVDNGSGTVMPIVMDEDGFIIEDEEEDTPVEEGLFTRDKPADDNAVESAEDKNIADDTDRSLGSYLQQITLLTDADEKSADADTVKLMTIHAAKGLEFGCVFAAGLEENLFPNAMSINTREELEEERRLFYVVVTRAKQKLWITYANSRYRFGSLIQNDPSRFISEIPEEYLDKSYAGGGFRNSSGFSPQRSAFERMNGGGFGNAERQAEKDTDLHLAEVRQPLRNTGVPNLKTRL